MGTTGVRRREGRTTGLRPVRDSKGDDRPTCAKLAGGAIAVVQGRRRVALSHETRDSRVVTSSVRRHWGFCSSPVERPVESRRGAGSIPAGAVQWGRRNLARAPPAAWRISGW